MSEVSSICDTEATYHLAFVLCLFEFLFTALTVDLFWIFFLKEKVFFILLTWQIQFSSEAYNEKAKTIFKKRTDTNTRSTPLEKNPHKQQESQSVSERDCYSSPHPKILVLNYNMWKQILTQHREVPARKSNYPQCKCFVCTQRFVSLGGAYTDQHNKTATLTEFLGTFVV